MEIIVNVVRRNYDDKENGRDSQKDIDNENECRKYFFFYYKNQDFFKEEIKNRRKMDILVNEKYNFQVIKEYVRRLFILIRIMSFFCDLLY